MWVTVKGNWKICRFTEKIVFRMLVCRIPGKETAWRSPLVSEQISDTDLRTIPSKKPEFDYIKKKKN